MNMAFRLSICGRAVVTVLIGAVLCVGLMGAAAGQADRQAIQRKLSGMRSLPDAERGAATKQIALEIRRLPASADKVNLAAGLANLATEGDFGRDALQTVTTTLERALRETKDPGGYAYAGLARLVYYEGMKADCDAPLFAAALAEFKAADKELERADFTLKDLTGKSWTLQAQRGKVVVVNFWATWCPPCRKELPDLEALHKRFAAKGLVILGITDEKADVVKPFVARQGMTYPVLLDPDRKAGKRFRVEGIPRTLIYGRTGKLAAQAVDMRTMKQFLTLLSKAGLR
jgi:peroxiredoxin